VRRKKGVLAIFAIEQIAHRLPTGFVRFHSILALVSIFTLLNRGFG
jgi:hypothetical protein